MVSEMPWIQDSEVDNEMILKGSLFYLFFFGFNLLSDHLFSGNGMDSVDYEARFLILKEDRQDEICRYLNFLDPVSFVFE